jgi:hypothetical protein
MALWVENTIQGNGRDVWTTAWAVGTQNMKKKPIKEVGRKGYAKFMIIAIPGSTLDSP